MNKVGGEKGFQWFAMWVMGVTKQPRCTFSYKDETEIHDKYISFISIGKNRDYIDNFFEFIKSVLEATGESESATLDINSWKILGKIFNRYGFLKSIKQAPPLTKIFENKSNTLTDAVMSGNLFMKNFALPAFFKKIEEAVTVNGDNNKKIDGFGFSCLAINKKDSHYTVKGNYGTSTVDSLINYVFNTFYEINITDKVLLFHSVYNNKHIFKANKQEIPPTLKALNSTGVFLAELSYLCKKESGSIVIKTISGESIVNVNTILYFNAQLNLQKYSTNLEYKPNNEEVTINNIDASTLPLSVLYMMNLTTSLLIPNVPNNKVHFYVETKYQDNACKVLTALFERHDEYTPSELSDLPSEVYKEGLCLLLSKCTDPSVMGNERKCITGTVTLSNLYKECGDNSVVKNEDIVKTPSFYFHISKITTEYDEHNICMEFVYE